MDPSHFRGLQPPASHVIPGAPGAVGHPTHSGFMDPPAIIPAAFLNDIVTMIRDEFSAQNRFISNQYSNLHSELKENHNEMKEGFRSCTHQTDRILTEQHFQFERKLDAIQKGMLQFHESQMTAIADLGARLGALESLTEASRDALGSKITAISETMGHEFDGFVMMVKNEYAVRDPFSRRSRTPVYNPSLEAFANFSRLPDDPPFAGNTGSEPAPDHIDGVEEALTPNTRPQTNSEVDITPGSGELQEELPAELPPVAVLSDPESSLASSSDNLEIEEQDRLYGRDIPMASTPATEELSDPPNTGTDDITMVPALPLTISLKEIFIASTAERDPSQDPPRQDPPLWDPPLQGSPLRDFPPQDPLFGALSPLTSTDSLGSQNHATPEIEIPAPFPLSPNWASRKRKRSHGRGTLKNPRKGRKSHVQLEQEDASYMLLVGQSEGNHADPSIWPPVIEDATSSQMYVECDRCAKWFHVGCVGLPGDHKDGSPWDCPPCARDPARDAGSVPRNGEEMCSRPGCISSQGQEFFMDRLLGRCYVPDQDVVKYLVSYDGYQIDQCTWEPPESFSNDLKKMEDFLAWWATENPGVDVESLDPRETIFLHDAYVLARAGVTWPGA